MKRIQQGSQTPRSVIFDRWLRTAIKWRVAHEMIKRDFWEDNGVVNLLQDGPIEHAWLES